MRLGSCKYYVLAAALIAAGSAATAIPSPFVTDTGTPDRRAAFCAAFLDLDIRPPQSVNRRRRTVALNAWRAELRRLRPTDAGGFLGSAHDVIDNATVDMRRDSAIYCESYPPVRRRR